MRDPNYPESSHLALRIHLEPTESLSETLATTSVSPAGHGSTVERAMSTNCKFIRSSCEGLAALQRLSSTSSILLFTPVLIPANGGKASRQKEIVDPFEAFGRALSTYHKRIRQVPYVPKTGFTETHAAFVSQADAIVTVVCEPTNDKGPSVARQLAFAEAVLEAVEDKEANASSMLVLVQCGSDQHRRMVDAAFLNIVEVSTYNDDIAKQLARTIFKFRR